MEEAVMILWSLWEARNNICWTNKQSAPFAILYRAKKELEEWRNANWVDETLTGGAVNSKNTKWELPPLDTIKCNTNASYDIHTGLAGVGMVLRDHLGQFIAGKTIFIGRVASPLLAEIIGVREALTWLKERFGTTRLVVKTDNLLVKQAVEGNLVNYSYFDALVFDCKTLLKELPFFSLSSVKKSANQVAHYLARASASMSGSMEWNTIPPSLITEVLAFDLNNT